MMPTIPAGPGSGHAIPRTLPRSDSPQYHPYRRHPRDTVLAQGTPLKQTELLADEFYHLFRPSQTGAPRPEVPLAAAYLRALKSGEYDDADLRRKITSQYMGVMFETDIPDQDDLPSEEEMTQLI